MSTQINTQKLKSKKRRRNNMTRASNLIWPESSMPQIPGETYKSFDDSEDQSFVTVQKSDNTEPEMENDQSLDMERQSMSSRTILPFLERGDNSNHRNIHVLTAHKPGPSNKQVSSASVAPFPNRPKGVPLTFLSRQVFHGAIEPQQGPTDQPTTVPGQINTFNHVPYSSTFIQTKPSFNQPIQMPQQLNQIYRYPMQMPQPLDIYGQQQNMLGQKSIFGQQNMMAEHPITNRQRQPFFQSYAQSGQAPQMPNPSQHSQVYSLPNIQMDNFPNDSREQYSPTDVYDENESKSDNGSRDSDSADDIVSKQRRQSAFDRLGPQAKESKPKLTINLCLDKEQPVREVVEETKMIPVYERDEIMTSIDPTVMKFRCFWPWKNGIPRKRSVTARSSKTVMMLEREQVEEEYKNDNLFMIVSVVGFPPSWSKENVLDAILEDLKEKSFIPCFIEFSAKNCKFLVNRCRSALLALHYHGFSIRKGDVELMITISVTTFNTRALDFIPRLIIRNMLVYCYDGKRVDLSQFTLRNDISHFIYYPLNRPTNQQELMELVQGCDWDNLDELDLSHNRLTSIGDFNLISKLPKLRHLNLSYNMLDNIKAVLPLRGLMLHSLSLEGNPLCLNYVDEEYYIKVLRTLFPCLRVLDGVSIPRSGQKPELKRHYCLRDAQPLVEKFVSYFFRLLDLEPEQRKLIVEMYHTDAMLTVTSRMKLRFDHKYNIVRQLWLRSRCLADGNFDFIQGSEKISKAINKWPQLRHDKHSFNIDVLMHTETNTLLRINGVVSTRAASLAEDERLLAFTRTVLLVSNDECEYKIHNEMLYWDEPTKECAEDAFRFDMVQDKTMENWKFELPLDDESKNRLIDTLSNLTGLNSQQSSRCLEEKDWDLKIALEHFINLFKLDNIECLSNHL